MSQIKDKLQVDYFFCDKHIYNKIRAKNLQQYVAPYKVLDMRDIATAFDITVEQVETELAQLITSGNIKAKIDSHKKLLISKKVNAQLETYQQVNKAGDKFI